MNFNEFRYIIDEAGMMLWRRKGANIISILIMGLSLLVVVVFVLVTLNISRVIGKAGTELRIFVYLEDAVDGRTAENIQYRLLGMKGVEEVVFISRREALDDFKQSLGEGSDFLDDLEFNPLPDAYRVKLKPDYLGSRFMERLGAEIGSWEGVEEARYGKRWIERAEKLVKGFYMVDFVLGLIIFLSVVFVISNTVRLTVLYRRKTIEVMKLVGATNAYIRTPFIIEGALQGIIASLLAIGLLCAVFTAGCRYLPELVFLGWEAIVIFITFCALLGAAVSFAAMRRFLKI